MNARSDSRKNVSNKGIFLVFVVGLFLLQIAFAFTIHGDIGPQAPTVPGVEHQAPPLLVGRIDSLIGRPTIRKPVSPAPEAIMAPAVREKFFECNPKTDAVTDSESGKAIPKLHDNGDRYLQYMIVKGDTLAGISKRLYGSSKMISALVRVNRIQNDRNLRPGGMLLVPRSGLISN